MWSHSALWPQPACNALFKPAGCRGLASSITTPKSQHVWQGLCRGEALSQPCPRAVLVCCSALVCGGLATEGLFSKGQRADPDAVHWLLGGLRAGV